MIRLAIALLAVGLFGIGCGQTSPQGSSKETGGENASATTVGDYLLGAPIKHENLTIFPVSSNTPRTDDRFITLDEGLKAGTVEILEIGAGQPNQPAFNPAANPNSARDPGSQSPIDEPSDPASVNPPNENAVPDEGAENNQQEDEFDELIEEGSDNPPAQLPQVLENDLPQQFAGNNVNQLMVINRSGKPLYLMPGEIIVGGDQDRTIGEELVIQPGDKPVPIEVFCVEHGRWGVRGHGETLQALNDSVANATRASSVALANIVDLEPEAAQEALKKIAEEADRGKFVATVGALNKGARQAVQQTGEQGKVWDEVAVHNAKGGVMNESGAFTGNYVEDDAVKRLEPYIEALEKPVAETKQIVGVIVAVNGKVQSMDVFQSTPLFKKLWPKLLKSYAVDAANMVEEKDADAVCTLDAAQTFLTEAMTADVEKSETKQGICTTSRSNDRLVTFSAADENAAAPAQGFGDAVHAAAYAK